MKYIVGLIVVIFLVRIDLFIAGGEKIYQNILKLKPEPPAPPAGNVSPSEVIPIGEDKAIEVTPRSELFSLLNDFHLNPNRDLRNRMIDLLRKHQNILTEKIDPVFEGEVFKMTDLIQNRSPELPFFLADLLTVLKGDNLAMVKRFSAILLDHDVETFVTAFSRSPDTTCSVATLLAWKVPEDEILNEYMEREYNISQYLAKEKLDPTKEAYAKNCQTQVSLLVSKMAATTPPPAPSEPEASPEEAMPTPTPVSP